MVTKIVLPLANAVIAQLPLEDVTVIWVELPATLGAVTVTVKVVDPEPVDPDGTLVGATTAVHAGLEDAIETVIVELGVTPVQANPHDCTVVEPAATTKDNPGGVMLPPQTVVAAAMGVATPRTANAARMVARLTFSTLDVFTSPKS